MRGLWSYSGNEKGSTLVLALFLVLLLSALSVPLLLSLGQGNVNNKKGERTEQAQYAAESGMAIVKRVMQEAFYNENMELTADQVNDITSGVNKLPLMTGTVETNSSGNELKSTGKAGWGILNRTRFVLMSYEAQQGSSAPPGIFGTDVVSKYLLDNKNKVFYDYQNLGFAQPYVDFDQEFRAAFQTLMADQPEAADYFIPTGESPFCENPSLPNGVECDSNHNVKFKYINNTDITVDTDVITKGNITFETSRTVTINGDVIAGGKIEATGKELNLIVAGSIYANGAIQLNNRNSSITGNLVSYSQLTFGSEANAFSIGKDVVSAGSLNIGMNTFSSIDIGGNVSSQGNIAIGTINRSLAIGGSVYSGGTLDINSIALLSIDGSVLSTGTITFKDEARNTTIKGALLTLGNLDFKRQLNKLVVEKTVGCLGEMSIQGLNGDHSRFGGAAIGSKFTVTQTMINNSHPKIVITYNPPLGGGEGERFLRFSNWSGGSKEND